MEKARDLDATRTEHTGSASDVPPLAHSAEWGDLRLVSELGHGGFGRVYRAWDESLAREVALKVIKPRDAAQRASVLIEGQMLARVSHRNVVTVYRAQQIDDEVGLTMELIKGRHLAHVVDQTGPMGAEEASVIGISLCQALAAVHAAGLLHRDVKAHNVMRESGGRIVLMDFGAGRHVSESRISDLSGTPLYLAPELFTGQAASPASDLYSLGVLLFYLVTRKHPVEGRTLTEIMLLHNQGDRKLLSDLRPDLPGGFVQVVHRALAPTPDQRFRSAGAMLAELMDAMPGAARQRADGAALPIPIGEKALGAGSDAAASPREGAVVTPVRRVPVAVRAVIALTGAFAVVLVLGYLTTVHYDRAIGRSQDFSGEGFPTWLQYGFRSLLPTTIYTTVLMLIVRLFDALWHFVQRLAPPVRRLTDHARSSISGTFGRLAGWDGASRAQFLLLMQMLTFGLTLWVYRGLIALLPVTVNEADPASLAVLAPLDSNGLLFTYTAVMSVLLGTGALCWGLLRRNPLLWATVPATSVAAAAALMALMLLLIAVPDRLFFKSVAPEVLYQAQRCFVTGEKGDERLLYCPEREKQYRTPTVKVADLPSGERNGRIFSLPAPAAPK
ncbi:MAG TPA: serine/threonine-protein kinase [Vicinamibacterales bacterium]|nr:serine/threonine-protein kinase [Vicinamibacterales bacterium]